MFAVNLFVGDFPENEHWLACLANFIIYFELFLTQSYARHLKVTLNRPTTFRGTLPHVAWVPVASCTHAIN